MKSQDLSQLLIVASLARQNLRMSASIDGPSSDQETESGAEEGSSDRKVVEAMDVLIQLLTQTESLETVSTYLPCLALLPRASFEDETRTNKIARLFRRCVEGNSDERVCKPIAKMCEENPALGSLAALSVLKGKESEANWRMLSLVSFADTRNQGIGEISSECGSSKFLLNIGSVQVDIVPFLKEFSNCFKSEEMLKLYSGALFSVVSEILKRNNPGDEELLRFCVGQLFNHCEETIYEFYNFPTYLSAAVKVLLWAQPSTETQRSRFSKILTTMVARNENFLEFIASEVSKGGGLNFAEEILRILDGKGFDYLDTAPILLKHLLGRPSARLDLLDGVDIAQWNLLGIQEAVVECLHSELTNLEQMKFAWDALCDRSFLNLKMFLNERNGEKIAFLVEQLPGIGTEELAHVLKNHLDNPKWVSMAKKLLDGDECAFRDFVFSLKDDEKFANLVFSSAEPKTGAVLFESYWHSISDLDRKKKLQDHIALHYDLKSLLLSNISNVPHIDTFVNRVTAYDELVVKGILPAPVSLRAVVDKILQSSDGLEILLKGPLWSALLNATAKWEMNTEEVARSAFELFSADRKDLLPCFRKHIEENPVRFIQLIPASVTSILTNILEAGDVQESVKDAVLDYVKNFSEDQIFSLQIFRLLRVVEKTPWKREEFRFLPAKIAARKSNKLQCEFLNLLKFMPIDERFYEMLVTAWIPLRYSESDEKLHAFLESEDCLLWKNLLLTVFLIEENNPGPKKIIRWLDKNSGKLKNSAPLLEAVISLCVEGGDSLPRLPSIHELRQFKLIEDVLIRMIDNMSADALKGILAKSMEDGSLNQVLTNGFGTGLKEMALLVVFKKFIEKNKEWGERIASQELKTSLVQRCLCHLKNPLNDGSDPFLKWKLHCHAFNLIATIYSKLDSLHPEFLNEVFSSAAVWDRIAGESTVVGMEFGDQISSKSGIRKRKASQKVESQDEHDFTKSPENKKIDVVSLASAKRIFDFDSHPCLHALISLASLWFDVPGNESEKLPLWLKIFTDVIRPDLGQVNTKIIFLRFLHACGKRFGCLQSVLDVAASQCLATVLLCGASIDCTFVQESFALCSEIGSNLAQFVFDKIFEGPTNSDRCAYLKLFRKFYNSNIHQINTRTLEESVSPSVSWCRNEVLAIFWRKNRSFAISNVGRFDWKRVAGPMFDFSGATSEDSRNSLAKMIAGAFGFAKQMGDAHLSTSLLELVRKYLQKLGTNEEVLRAIQIMSEGCDEIVDEFYEKPLQRSAALLRKVDLTKKIVPLLSLELNTPNRLLLLSAIEVLCRSNFYDHSAKKNLLEKFLSRFPEEQPKSAHLAVFIQLHENFPETVAQYINSVWGSLNSELKGFLVKRWIQKNARIPTVCDRLNPELALRLIVGNGDIVEFFAGGGDKRKASELLSSFLEEEPQFVLEMLKGNSVENKILKSCVDTAVMKFLPRAAWKAMKLLDHSTEDFQEILEIYGSPRNIQPAKVRDDLEALRIARNCFSPEDALDFLRRCKNLSVQATSLLDRIFEGHFTLEEFMDDESEGELLRFIQNLMILKTENWSSLQSLTVKDPSRIEVEIFCRAQLENKKADKNFWTQTASVFHFEHQIYHLEHRIQQLDHGSKVVVLLRKLKNGILHVWSEVDEALRVVLLRRIRAISDAESMIRVLSGGDINERLLELCKAWLTATECRCTHLRRIRFLKSLTRHAGCSARSFALLSTAIATNYIQLLKMGISLEDPQTDSTADFLLKDRRMELLTELRKFLPGCEERTRGALISDAEKLADNF
ncbi:hypothetical protein L596_018877 [Steinernema carpocapsae]|uniref:Uncharacterized protein n=1 Tax=Steinernema carpocapsae TaxID=34508 RepID=A0A4U5N5Y6_STECR|nr:hypothetical protein L596_018877 [Steinernema carpocapsae]